MLDVKAGDRLANLWDAEKAAGMSEPELLLYRSNLLGADKRITNYGGGNTSAKVDREGPADRRAGRGAVGQGLRRRHRHDEARRLLHALHGQARSAEDGSIAASSTRTRWWATSPTAPSTSTRAPPRSTRRCTPSCRTPMSITCTPTRSSPSPPAQNSQGADAARSSATRSAGCRGSGPGFELGLLAARSSAATTRRRRAWCSKPRPLHLGRHVQGLLRDHARHHQPRHRLARRQRPPASPPSAAQARRRCRAAERRARSPRALMPAIRGMISRRRAQGRPFRRPAGGAGVRRLATSWRRWRRSAPSCPDHFLRTKIRPLVRATSIRPSPTSTRRSPARRRGRGLSRRTTPPITSAASTPNSPGDARPQRGGLPGARRRHDHLRQGQGDGAHRRRVLRQRHQRDARRLRRLDLSSACPSRKPSTSNTGCSKRPSCSACRSRRALAGRVALVTGGAGGIGQATARAAAGRRRLRRARRHRRDGARRRRRRARQDAIGSDVVRGVELDVTDEDAVDRAPSPTPRSSSAASTSWSPTPASPPRRRSRRPTLALWNKNMDILATGYFLVAREAFRLLKAQKHRRRHRLRRLEERPRRLARRRRLLHGQGRRDPSRPLPRAGRRADRHPRQRRQPGRGAARLEDLAGEWREQRAAAYKIDDGRARGASTASARC